MNNLSLYILGASLAVVSIATILYSVGDLRDSSMKRHYFFKGIKLFLFLYLIPVFLLIGFLNIRAIIKLPFRTVPEMLPLIIYIISVIGCFIVTIVFIYNPVMSGIRMFRRNNKDNMKYNRAITKSRNGLLIILVIILVTLFINKP